MQLLHSRLQIISQSLHELLIHNSFIPRYSQSQTATLDAYNTNTHRVTRDHRRIRKHRMCDSPFLNFRIFLVSGFRNLFQLTKVADFPRLCALSVVSVSQELGPVFDAAEGLETIIGGEC